jgi:7-carboxy-7-deazaguanine synthase
MFGKNPIATDDRKTLGEVLSVVKGSPWITIQGEGPFVGHPAVFIRLHGCPLRCIWCDTQFSNIDDPLMNVSILAEMVLAEANKCESRAQLVVISGGEPTRQNLKPLITHLHRLGFRVQIETAGIFWQPGLETIEIVCSPKTSKIDPRIYAHAAAFKYIIDHKMKFDKFIPITATQPGARPSRLAAPRPDSPIYLSPMDAYEPEHNRLNRLKVIELALRYGVYAGVQLHKILEIEEP